LFPCGRQGISLDRKVRPEQKKEKGVEGTEGGPGGGLSHQGRRESTRNMGTACLELYWSGFSAALPRAARKSAQAGRRRRPSPPAKPAQTNLAEGRTGANPNKRIQPYKPPVVLHPWATSTQTPRPGDACLDRAPAEAKKAGPRKKKTPRQPAQTGTSQ